MGAVHRFIGKIGGKKFVVTLLTLLSVVVASLTGYEIQPEIFDKIVWVVCSFLVGQGVADGLSRGATSSTTE